MPERSHSRWPLSLVAVAIAMTAGLAVAPAHAQVAAHDQAEASALALALNRRGKELYQQGRYAEAVVLLHEAYRLKPEPVLQYNLARACEKMGDYACAVAAYERYLASAPGLADRAAIEAQLAGCRARLVAAPPLPPAERPALAPPTPPLLPAGRPALARPTLPPQLPEPVAPEPSHSVVPPIVGGVGVVGIGIGLGLISAGLAKHHDALNDLTQRGAEQKQERADSLLRAGSLTLEAGAAVAIGGILWWILDARSGRSGATEAAGTVRAIHIGARSIAFAVTF